jgi:hypothetical protein
MKSIVRFIEEKLGLIVNVEKSKISRPKELKFLGFGYYYDVNNQRYQVKPHLSSIQKFQRKLRKLTKRNLLMIKPLERNRDLHGQDLFLVDNRARMLSGKFVS